MQGLQTQAPIKTETNRCQQTDWRWQLHPALSEADALNMFRWLHWIHLLFYAACRFQMFRQIQWAILQYDALHLYGYWKQIRNAAKCEHISPPIYTKIDNTENNTAIQPL